MAGLFVGRFQPFHLGHLDAIKQAFCEEDYLTIVIGSAEDNFTPENPFSAGERFQMIEAALVGEKVGQETVLRECFNIIPVRNINNYALWVTHVASLVPPFETVYTASPIVKILFKNAGYKVFPLKINLKISATSVRKKMLSKKGWEKMVPEKVAKLLKKWNAVKRLRGIQ